MNEEANLFCEMYDNNKRSELEEKFPFDEMVFSDNMVDEESNGSGRWEDFVTTVLKMGNRYFAFDWCRGKTEMQVDDFSDSKYYEVVPKAKTITVTEYVPKE